MGKKKICERGHFLNLEVIKISHFPMYKRKISFLRKSYKLVEKCKDWKRQMAKIINTH